MSGLMDEVLVLARAYKNAAEGNESYVALSRLCTCIESIFTTEVDANVRRLLEPMPGTIMFKPMVPDLSPVMLITSVCMVVAATGAFRPAYRHDLARLEDWAKWRVEHFERHGYDHFLLNALPLTVDQANMLSTVWKSECIK